MRKNNILNLHVLRSHVVMKMYIYLFLLLSQLQFRLRKCKSKDNSRSCQDFFKFEMDKICSKLAQKNQVWSGFLEEMDIDTKCPIQPVSNDLHSILPGIYCMCECRCVRMYVSTYVCMYVCVRTHVCLWVCVCMYV